MNRINFITSILTLNRDLEDCVIMALIFRKDYIKCRIYVAILTELSFATNPLVCVYLENIYIISIIKLLGSLICNVTLIQFQFKTVFQGR